MLLQITVKPLNLVVMCFICFLILTFYIVRILYEKMWLIFREKGQELDRNFSCCFRSLIVDLFVHQNFPNERPTKSYGFTVHLGRTICI